MATITEDYVSFEIAKLLKEKEFNCKCIAYYLVFNENIKFYECSNLGQNLPYVSNDNWRTILRNPLESGYAAPTHQMAMKWLRKVHTQHIQISYFHGAYLEYEYVVINTFNGKAYHEPVSFSSYEEAVEAAIKYCLENLIV